MVGAERAREREPLREPVDHDDGLGAHVARHRDRVEAEAARALHDQRVPGAEPGAPQAVEHLGEGAVAGGGDVVGDLVGDPEHEVAGAQVVVVPVRVVEVRGRARDPAGPGLARAAPRLVVQAHGAAPAGEEVEVRHPVALAEGLAPRVGGDAGPQPLDATAHLVAEREVARARAVDLLHLAAPDVEVGAADARAGQAHEDGARLHFRHGILPQLELTPVRPQHRHATRHVSRSFQPTPKASAKRR